VHKFGATLFVVLFLAAMIQPGDVLGRIIEVGPTDAWCNAINNASPGDEIVLISGLYTTPCMITPLGTPSNWVTIRSKTGESNNQSTFAYSGSTSNVLELRDAAFLIIRGFAFSPTQDGVDAIRIRQANDIIIEDNFFQGIGGVSIPANDRTTQRIVIRSNVFRDLKSTALYFGCHDGIASCVSSELLIENNFINGVEPTDSSSIGYGLQIKLNSYGTVRDNTIYNTKGPGIMVYGSNRIDLPSIVEGNYVEGSRNEGGIVIGGGPAIVRNNVLVGNAYGGISAQNYGGRDLQKKVWIIHNTILDNDDSGINVAAWQESRDNVIAFNAMSLRSGTSSIRPSFPTGTIMGNVNCTVTASCFVNSTTPPYDLWPASDTDNPLINVAGNGTEAWRPADDFMGIPRGLAADVGAFERTSTNFDRSVGAENPRPLRVSTDTSPPSAPTHLQIR